VYVDLEVVNIRISDIVWLVANNIDPLRDCFYALNKKGEAAGPMALDGSRKSLAFDSFKRQWPNVLVMDDVTINQVDAMWGKLGLGEMLASPSLNYKALVKNVGAVAEG
jgi:4-hydroxy-3-polyprenylbenzoate decarboxylase